LSDACAPPSYFADNLESGKFARVEWRKLLQGHEILLSQRRPIGDMSGPKSAVESALLMRIWTTGVSDRWILIPEETTWAQLVEPGAFVLRTHMAGQ